MRYDIDIFHYIEIYKRHSGRMVFLIIIAMLGTAMFQSMQPTTYRSTLIALSSKQIQASNIEKLFGSSDSSDEIIFSILKSRRMSNDIYERFKLKDKPRFKWNLDTYVVTGGFAIEVTGSDPDLTRDIANFAASNVDAINDKIDFSTEKGMVKVLDRALKGAPVRRAVSKKTMASGLFIFFVYTLFIFFGEYFSQLKSSRKK